MESFSSASAPWGIFDQLIDFTPFRQANIGNLHAQLLFNRGIQTPEAMRRFLDADLKDIPSPNGLIDMKPALDRIRDALNKREHITVYGDFDADGVTSAALMTRALRRLGQPAERLTCYIPSRLHGARGLSREAINRLKNDGTELIITTDCGSSDVEEVNYAQNLGIDVIITDHHHPPAQLPQATAMINPWRPDCTYGERYLCGVGIAFKLAQGLYRAAGYEQEVQDLLDLVAVGTVADVALLLGENHTLVREGMLRLKKTSNPGLDTLIQVSRLQKDRIRERDISFVLAPRINAAGRMEDAALAFELLTTNDSEQATKLANKLEALNFARQQQTEELMKLVRAGAQEQLKDDKQVILIYGEKESWPEGIIGLVAGKLAEEIRRPVFVLSQDSEASRGSARGPEHFNIIQALQAARPNLFERFGGHAQAAGFTIANANIDELHTHLLSWYEQSQRPNGSSVAIVVPQDESAEVVSISVEAELPPPPTTRKADLVIKKPERLNMEMLDKINLLSPFGAGNPEPVFQIDALLERHWLSGNERQHLRLRLSSRSSKGERLTFDGTLLRGAKRAESLKDGTQVRVLFSLEEAWNRSESEARPKIWLKIVDIVPLGQ